MSPGSTGRSLTDLVTLRTKQVLGVVGTVVVLVPSVSLAQAPTVQDRIVAAAESYLGKPYVFGGRDGRPGCRRDSKRVRCRPGIDCQSLIFFAYEEALGRHWTRPVSTSARGSSVRRCHGSTV